MMSKLNLCICFVNYRGFMVYHKDSSTITYTLHIEEASEAVVSFWLSLSHYDDETHTLLARDFI